MSVQYDPATEPALVIKRFVKAPRDLVFKVWTEAEHLAKWWGPKGMAIEVARLELRPGGLFHYFLSSPEGHTMWGKFVYREIAAPEKLVYVSSFSDAEGNTTRGPFSATWPLEVLNTLHFTEQDGGTMITLSGGPLNPTEEELSTFRGMIPSMNQGFGGTFDQLDAYLATVHTADREIVQIRTFDAPRELVFRAWTSVGHLSRWWGPNGFTTTTHEMDFRPGGVWRFTMHGPDGTDWPNRIVYTEIAAPERLVYAHGGDSDEPDFHVTVTFADLGGKTALTMRSLFPTAEARQAVEKFGAVELGRQTLARLADYLPTMQ